MTATLLGRLAVAATMIASVALTAAPAGAETTVTHVTLTARYQHSHEARTATLSCNPAGGTHPHAAEACESIAAAKGDFGAVRPQKAQCPLIYQPVTVGAYGIWRSEPLRFTKTYSNSCTAAAQTDGIFDF